MKTGVCWQQEEHPVIGILLDPCKQGKVDMEIAIEKCGEIFLNGVPLQNGAADPYTAESISLLEIAAKLSPLTPYCLTKRRKHCLTRFSKLHFKNKKKKRAKAQEWLYGK